MTIMWITNQLIGDLAAIKNINAVTGQWLNAELDIEKKKNENRIIICTIGKKNEVFESGNIKYIVLGLGNLYLYQPAQHDVKLWKQIIDSENPDMILIWGTEYSIGLGVLLANNNRVPTAIYVQGVMKSIYENYKGGLTDTEINNFTTLVEKIRRNTIYDNLKELKNRSIVEDKVIRMVDYLILENDWSEKIYKEINPSLRILRSRLPVKNNFVQKKWNLHRDKKHQIITTASGYPLKGLHILLKAVSIVKKEYNDVKLMVPGNNMVFVEGFLNKLKQRGYHKFLLDIIHDYDLFNNIVFTGPLDSEHYANLMSESELFVCPSFIENHCSTLREAMMVGVPCIATNVGGIPEYAFHGDNCLLYEPNDYEELSSLIISVFEDETLQEKLSSNSKRMIKELYRDNSFLSMDQIYSEIINKKQRQN